MRYPPAARLDVVDDVAGHHVADPYRWLEDPADPATVEWSAAQDRLWAEWRGRLAGRDALVERLTDLVPAFRGPPQAVGGRRFWMARRPDQDHAVLWVGEEQPDGTVSGARPLVDPNAMDPDGTVTLDGWAPSLEGTRLAYLCSAGGDEESRLWVVDVATGDLLDGPVDRTRYSPLAWLPGGEQLFYVRRLPPDRVPAGEEQFHRRLWLHRVGEDPEGDPLVFGEALDPTAYLGVTTSEDGRWAAVTVSVGTAPRNDLWLGALDGAGTPAAPAWHPVAVGDDAQAWPAFDRLGELWVLTDAGAPRRRLCVARPGRVHGTTPAGPVSAPALWREVLPEDTGGAVLADFALAVDTVTAVRLRHGLGEVTVHDRVSGAPRHAVALPGAGSATVTGRADEGGEVWVGYTDFATPTTVFHLDPVAGELRREPPVAGIGPPAPPAGPARSTQVVYRSADGTEVRLTLVAPAADGDRPPVPRPTVLYGYGGFGVSLTPAYQPSVLAWVEAGGVYAVAHLRGGAEEGEAWHRAGRRDRKQRVFEDFEAAADWLVSEGWTTPGQLAAMGGSNGGLLVGAALTRRPHGYAAVVCSAPLLDMVRYERFGLGATWNDEFGCAKDPTEIEWLLDYSPYHRVREGVAYPAVLFTTFDHDTRVDPLHARKMCAALQWATVADPERAPVLLRRETDVGHGARSVRRGVELAADELAFLADRVGLALPAAPA